MWFCYNRLSRKKTGSVTSPRKRRSDQRPNRSRTSVAPSSAKTSNVRIVRGFFDLGLSSVARKPLAIEFFSRNSLAEETLSRWLCNRLTAIAILSLRHCCYYYIILSRAIRAVDKRFRGSYTAAEECLVAPMPDYDDEMGNNNNNNNNKPGHDLAPRARASSK